MFSVQCSMGVHAASTVQSVRQQVLRSSSLDLQEAVYACIASLCTVRQPQPPAVLFLSGCCKVTWRCEHSMAGLWHQSDLIMQAPQCTSTLLTLCWYCMST